MFASDEEPQGSRNGGKHSFAKWTGKRNVYECCASDNGLSS